MTALQLYLFIKLDAIILLAQTFMTPCFVIGIIALIVWLVLWVVPYGGEDTKPEDVKKLKIQCENIRRPVSKILMWTFIVWLPLRLIASLLPSTKEMAIIYVVPKIINNEMIAQIPDKLLKLSSEWIDELRPQNVKNDIKAIVQQPSREAAEAVDTLKKP